MLTLKVHTLRYTLYITFHAAGNRRMHRERISMCIYREALFLSLSFSRSFRLVGTVSQARLAITGGFTAFFQLQNSKPVSRVSIECRLSAGLPCYLPLRNDSSRACPERSLVNSTGTEKVRFLARLCSHHDIEFLTFIVQRLGTINSS